jgi:Flp pilus assembly protein TadB
MGRRSRKRAAEAGTRAERDAARRERAQAAAQGRPVSRPRPGRPSIDERPPAPWGNFPLSELVILLGIGLMIWGLATWRGGGSLRFGAGLALAALAGAELSLREHLAGYRSHTTLLSGVAAFATVTILVLAAGHSRVWVAVAAGAVVFAGSFYVLRELFKRRSGGLGFR